MRNLVRTFSIFRVNKKKLVKHSARQIFAETLTVLNFSSLQQTFDKQFNATIDVHSRLSSRNSKPLPMSEGYWAEPWPVSETPLCAVIDPARDYRWHALRCGGPETAAFLCEMESKFLTFSFDFLGFV